MCVNLYVLGVWMSTEAKGIFSVGERGVGHFN